MNFEYPIYYINRYYYVSLGVVSLGIPSEIPRETIHVKFHVDCFDHPPEFHIIEWIYMNYQVNFYMKTHVRIVVEFHVSIFHLVYNIIFLKINIFDEIKQAFPERD